MKLTFKQKFFSWFDSYNIFDEQGDVYFRVDGKLAFGHSFDIFDKEGKRIASLKQEIFRFLPHYKMYIDDEYVGEIVKEFSFFTHRFSLDYESWTVKGNFLGWDYDIFDRNGDNIAHISKQLFNFTDTYEIEVNEKKNALVALMITISIDAIKCSQSNDNC